VQNVKGTHVREGATEPGRNGPGPVAQAGRPGPFHRQFSPPFLECEYDATLSTWMRQHSQGESHSPERPPQVRKEGEEKIIHEEDHSTRRKQPQLEEDVEALPRHPWRTRKTPSEASP
jgi:hypothetical protein